MVALSIVDTKDPDLRTVQQNVDKALRDIQAEQAAVGVLAVSSNTKLVGNEDVVLVDSSAASAEIALVLPGPRQFKKIVTVKVIKAGSSPVRVKAVDIPATNSPTIDGAASVAIPAGAATSIRITTDGRNFWTLD